MLARPVWVALGALSLALGLLGVMLPVLPTTPLVLLAAFCFGKGSPRLRLWLDTHPAFGEPIRQWEESGAIAPAHKRLAVTMMGATWLVSLAVALPWPVLAIQAVCLSGAGWYVWTRPDAP
ncbi:YbaN family protein [Thalassococcus sp. CAU 1522]|uniref:YbaN family protein n=1 Tax=Thalassococcus arenae TaxID=2851652 RepID=A0ABS6NAM9_9RHOB|nr:YbaN family protein [Thalassococcus arenae]